MPFDFPRRTASRVAEGVYRMVRPLIFRRTPDSAHALAMQTLAILDRLPQVSGLMGALSQATQPTLVGSVSLPMPVMIAAGLVKGLGFTDEASALDAVERGINIMPGLIAAPRLRIPVELGSFTRAPRIGNPAPVLWRDVAGRSLQNRVGLKNPGARAAALFIAAHPPDSKFGINLATTPGIDDPLAQQDELLESLAFFQQAHVRPDWLTLNLSCPNTETDPRGNQSRALAEVLCKGISKAWPEIPLWVKVGPDLSDLQLVQLAEVFAESGVRAVIATNTIARPVPDRAGQAGLSGRGLRPLALETVRRLNAIRSDSGAIFDLVGCGGIMDGGDVYAYTEAGAMAVQIWSAMVFRGLLAASQVAHEFSNHSEKR